MRRRVRTPLDGSTHARGGIPGFRKHPNPEAVAKSNEPATRDWTVAPLDVRCANERRDLLDGPPARTSAIANSEAKRTLRLLSKAGSDLSSTTQTIATLSWTGTQDYF